METAGTAEEDESVDGEIEAVPICLCCLSPYPEGAYFCSTCRAPIDPLVMYQPYQSIFAVGFFCRKAIEIKKTRLIWAGLLSLCLYQFPFGALICLRAALDQLLRDQEKNA